MGILEKIAEIEREINRTQKNKATEYHLGTLKAKLAKYRAQLLEPTGNWKITSSLSARCRVDDWFESRPLYTQRRQK